MYKYNLRKGLLFLILLSFTHCSSIENSKPKKVISSNKKVTNIVTVNSPKHNQNHNLGSSLLFSLNANIKYHFDSVTIQYDGFKSTYPGNQTNQFQVETNITIKSTGKTNIRINSYLSDTIEEADFIEITMLSDIVPEKLTYKVLGTHKHKKNAYTQGLVYRDGYIFEGCGNWGQSRLLKYKLDEEPEVENYIDQSLFGEGIEIFDDKIIQLTYRARKGFIYDKETFELIREFPYPYSQGWGVTYDGTNIIMSDGSNKLYFLDKINLSQVKMIEVYNNEGPVDSINEMEYVNGLIYANVYIQDYIIVIDPKTGKILQKIDMSGILPARDHHANLDVLNGIAYNHQTGTFYVTGKNWPKLFEVSFVKK